MSLDGPICARCLILEQYCICNIEPETLKLAEEALKRPRLTRDEAIAAGVDFILNCPLGEYPDGALAIKGSVKS
jgi:hypothetical protein